MFFLPSTPTLPSAIVVVFAVFIKMQTNFLALDKNIKNNAWINNDFGVASEAICQ